MLVHLKRHISLLSFSNSVHCKLLKQVFNGKKAANFIADDLLKAAKIILAEFGLPPKISFRCKHGFDIRDIQTILYTDEQRVGHNIIFSLPEQCSGGGVYKIHETHNLKCFDTNNNVNLAVLQI